MSRHLWFQGALSNALDGPSKSLQSVQNNYSELQELWDFVLDGNVDPDIRARVNGVRTQMESFDLFFGISLAELVLNHSENLSATFQSSNISAAEGKRVALLTVNTIAMMHTDESFSLFCKLVKDSCSSRQRA